jgi:hypothetical protein
LPTRALDVEGSIANLERAVSARLADTQTLRKQAAQQALAAQGHLDSLWREYETAAEKPSLLFVEKRAAKYEEDLTATRTEETRLQRHEDAIRSESLRSAVRDAAERLISEVARAGQSALHPVISRVFEAVVFSTTTGTEPRAIVSDVSRCPAIVLVGQTLMLVPIARREPVETVRWSYPESGDWDAEVPRRAALGRGAENDGNLNQLIPKASTPSARRTNLTAPPGPAPSISATLITE